MARLLSVSEAAKLLKCNRNKVYELINSGLLQGLKLGSMKVSNVELEAFIIRNTGMDLSDLQNVKPLRVGEENEMAK